MTPQQAEEPPSTIFVLGGGTMSAEVEVGSKGRRRTALRKDARVALVDFAQDEVVHLQKRRRQLSSSFRWSGKQAHDVPHLERRAQLASASCSSTLPREDTCAVEVAHGSEEEDVEPQRLRVRNEPGFTRRQLPHLTTKRKTDQNATMSPIAKRIVRMVLNRRRGRHQIRGGRRRGSTERTASRGAPTTS